MIKSGDRLLAVDTATQFASVALYDGISVLAEMTWKSRRRHTIELPPQVVKMLKQLDIEAANLMGLAVTLGPGSFTGLRIGLAFAKGLALARGIPLVGVPTLDVSVYPVGQQNGFLFATLQAGRGRLCVAPYRWARGRWRRAGDMTIKTWETLAAEAGSVEDGVLICGEIDAQGIDVLKAQRDKVTIVPAAKRIRRAGYLAELGWNRLVQGDKDNPATLQPIYLHTV